MSTVTRAFAATFVVALCVTAPLFPAQPAAPGPDMSIDESTRTAVIDGIVKELAAFYVYPDGATKMGQALRQHREQHRYDQISSARTFAETLTADLREVSHDKHLAINYSSGVVPPLPFPPPTPTREQIERQRAVMSQRNFGFEKVERLAGNVGYLDLRGFMPPTLMGDTAAAAMTFLSNTDALIIDLRQNGGGSPDGVAFLASYLFSEPQRLNDIYTRPTNETRQFWTSPHVPGRRLIDKDVYILTSSRTFSAAEDFTYGLKNLKRATVIGEVTGGGAHPVGPRRLTDHFVATVPIGRSISPVTHGDWEGVGVEPDVAVPAALALTRAHLAALQKALAATPESPLRTEITAAIARLSSELDAHKP
jgi:hypothetical protein